jgi:hypothetical protein
MDFADWNKAFVDDAKLFEYLLNRSHVEGAPKGRFLARFQSTSSREALRPSAQNQEFRPLSDEKPGSTFSESGLAANGFDLVDVEAIGGALLGHRRGHPVRRAGINGYGRKFEVEGLMTTPSGKTINVRTVWIVDSGQTAPRFVTLKPI